MPLNLLFINFYSKRMLHNKNPFTFLLTSCHVVSIFLISLINDFLHKVMNDVIRFKVKLSTKFN